MPTNPPAADLLVLHTEFVQRLARALAGDAGDDVAQDAWVRALAAAPPRTQGRHGRSAIVTNVGRNRVRGEGRRAHREQAVAAAAELPALPAVDEIVAREEVRQRVVAAVVALPEPLRAVVLLRFYEGLDA